MPEHLTAGGDAEGTAEQIGARAYSIEPFGLTALLDPVRLLASA